MTINEIWKIANAKYQYTNNLLSTKFIVEAQRKAFVEGYLEGQKEVKKENEEYESSF